jgi:hypothetical protein
MKYELEKQGFAIVTNVITEYEIGEIISIISNTNSTGPMLNAEMEKGLIQRFNINVLSLWDLIV